MAKTGESYTAARRRLLIRTGDPFSEAAAASANSSGSATPTAAGDAQRRRILAKRQTWIEQSTGRAMNAWVSVLDQAGAREMSHHDIWKWLANQGGVSGGELREGIVITYEQQIGRREIGQSCYGDFPASVSRVLKGTMDTVLDQWVHLVGSTRTFNGITMSGEPKVSATEKFRYWRARLVDGSHLRVSIWRMGDGRISLGVQHRAFEDHAAAAKSKAYWKEFLAPFSSAQAKTSEVE
jgi:hypothetical protein